MYARRNHGAAGALGKRGGRAGRGAAKRRGGTDYYRRLVALRRDRLRSGMEHRHLAHDAFTLAAIDDIIARGRLAEWAALRLAMARDDAVRAKVRRICEANRGDASAQRYRFWSHYAQGQAAA